MLVPQVISSIPQIVWIKTSIRTRVEGIKDQKKTISFFFTSDQMSDEAATNDSEDETLSGQSVDGNIERQTDKTREQGFVWGF